jgi:small-conductance mechanosensitive channel
MSNLDSIADVQLLSFGNISVTLGGVVAGLVVFLVAVAMARLVSRGLRRVRERASQRTTGAL